MKKLLILIGYFLSPIVLMAAILTQNPDKYTQIQYFIPMSLGVASYTWLLWQFVLSARPKFIEKHFGLDKMYRFHGTMALVALVGVVIHKLLNEQIFSETPMTQLGSIALALFAGISALSILFMSTRLLNRVPFIKFIVQQIEKLKVLTYERLKLIHNMTWIAMILMQIHVLMTTSAKNSLLVFNLYMIYFFIGMGSYIFHKAVKPWLLDSNRYIVKAVVQESSDIWSLHLASKIGRHMTYKPGQFGYFTILSENVPTETHPFSISSTPTNPEYLSITIKQLGDFTKHIGTVKPGDEAIVEGPYGSFSYLNYPQEKTSVFVVGGVGITPILSMVKHMKEKDPNRAVTLIWGIRTPADMIQRQELLALEKTMPNFKWIPVVSSDDTWSGLKGVIDLKTLQHVLGEKQNWASTTGFFLCGPPVMMTATQKNLKQLGISNKQIHFENFSA